MKFRKSIIGGLLCYVLMMACVETKEEKLSSLEDSLGLELIFNRGKDGNPLDDGEMLFFWDRAADLNSPNKRSDDFVGPNGNYFFVYGLCNIPSENVLDRNRYGVDEVFCFEGIFPLMSRKYLLDFTGPKNFSFAVNEIQARGFVPSDLYLVYVYPNQHNNADSLDGTIVGNKGRFYFFTKNDFQRGFGELVKATLESDKFNRPN